MSSLTVFRHGQSTYNLANLFIGKKMIGFPPVNNEVRCQFKRNVNLFGRLGQCKVQVIVELKLYYEFLKLNKT